MSPISSIPYNLIYGERQIKSVANNTRQDGINFLEEAAKIGITTRVKEFSFEEANKALYSLKYNHIQGAGVLVM